MNSELKTYTIASVNVEKIDSEIKNSGFVENYNGLNYTEGELSVIGDSLVDESSLDSLISAHDASTSQKDIDFLKYKKRASVKDTIIATMASDNMERVRNGVWTIEELTALTQDPELKLILDDVNTLSYELAVMKIQVATNPLVTESVKNEWVVMLASHFYN